MFPNDYTQNEIAGARSSAMRAESAATRAADDIKRLERRFAELTLICQAMWELLSDAMPDPHGYLRNKMDEIDLRDGVLAARSESAHALCANCERPLQKKQDRCLYCGQEIVFNNVFQRVLR